VGSESRTCGATNNGGAIESLACTELSIERIECWEVRSGDSQSLKHVNRLQIFCLSFIFILSEQLSSGFMHKLPYRDVGNCE